MILIACWLLHQRPISVADTVLTVIFCMRYTPCPEKEEATVFSTITMVVLIDFDNFCTVKNANEYYTKRVHTVSLQLNYVSTLPGNTKK